MTIRRLTGDDAPLWRAIRLEMLERHPDAFLTRLEDAREEPIDALRTRMDTCWCVGAFDGDALVGTVTVFRMDGAASHRASLVAAYVAEAARGQGVLGRLVEAALALARDAGVLQVELHVASDNVAAIAAYRRAGFDTIGHVPRALRSGERFHDETVMLRALDA